MLIVNHWSFTVSGFIDWLIDWLIVGQHIVLAIVKANTYYYQQQYYEYAMRFTVGWVW